MAEEAPTAAATEPPAAPATQPPAAEPSPAEETLSLDEAKKLRNEAKMLRQRAKAAEEELVTLKTAGQSDEEKRTGEITAREARISTLSAENRKLTVQALAGKIGIDPDLADLVVGAIKWDDLDEDDPKAAEKALKELVKDRPSLLAEARRQNFDGGAGGRNGTAQNVDMNTLIRSGRS